MLDRDTITQLSQLKQSILATKDYAEGTVTGTNGRYGFVKLDDGRSAFLNPEKMLHLLPGDRVRVNVVKNDKDQLEGELEALISSDLKRFVGRYKVKGNAHFVMPEGHTRWIFIPPQHRHKCRDNDFVLAEVIHHPFSDGKAAARILHRIGADGDDYLNQNLVIARFDLQRHWSKDAQRQADQCQQKPNEAAREDLTDLPFVTIDSASTRDMDDALYATPMEAGGWQLWVAIADPGQFITPGSPIAKSAKFYGQSIYLPGVCLPMLPDKLATETFSLVAGQERPALICKIAVSEEGAITSYEFIQARVQSRAKLTYTAVARLLEGEDADAADEIPDEARNLLAVLDQLAQARLSYRQQNNLVAQEQVEYDYQINKHGLIENVSLRLRNAAHRLVEEAMVATNLCAGDFLATHKTGLFSTNCGFRKERMGEVKALLREAFDPERDYDDIESLSGYLKLVKDLDRDSMHRDLLPPLRRMMQPTELSTLPAPHMSMGFECYAPVTSPIRRYADLANHWSIKQILNGSKIQTMPESTLELLCTSISNSRQAVRQLEQTLWVHYLQDKIGKEDEGTVRIVTQQGFGVRMRSTGIEGFVQFPKKTEKKFDAKRMTLTVGDRCYRLEQQVSVKVASVDPEKRRVKLTLTEVESREAEPETAAP